MREMRGDDRTLVLLVWREGSDSNNTNLLISCKGTLNIDGPVEWPNSKFEIEASPDGEGYVIRELNSELEVLAESVEVAENVVVWPVD